MTTLHSSLPQIPRGLMRNVSVLAVAIAVLCGLSGASLGRPSTSKSGKHSDEQIQTFLRQLNVYSNIEFYYTNRGVLFNAGNGEQEGCFWPRGSGNSYIFGEGLWFATKKILADGKRHQLCDLGYNPNSGAGWYTEGEASQVGLPGGTDGAAFANKYISYVSPRYDKSSGAFITGSTTVAGPAPTYNWPLWDTSSTKTLNHNYYFGDYIFNFSSRNNTALKKNGVAAKPAITSEEDIFNIYSDQDPSNNPEYRPGTGYPFGIDIQEEIYSWSFGRYRDMIFLRHKVKNSSKSELFDCYMAPAFDPDLDAAVGGAGNDANSYVDSALVAQYADQADVGQLRQPYRGDIRKMNMGIQWRNTTSPPNGKQYGWITFSFLESPVIDSAGNIIPNDDSSALHGYGPNSLFQTKQLGLTTFRDWTILNDPPTQDLRYQFVSSGEKDIFNGVYGDQRLLMATGPFNLDTGKSVETVVGIAIAQADNIDYKKNCGAALLLADFEHQVFGEVDSNVISTANGDTVHGYFVNHFVSPAPPNLPTLKATSLDRAVLLTWDSAAENSVLNILPAPAQYPDTALPFLGYQLWRSTRSDHDSTIRPDGNNPNVLLGQWQLYNYATDSVFDNNGHLNHFHYRRLNSTPNPIPHSYLDVGDDNHDGILSGTEGLYNNVPYYYYLIAYNEFDSLNQVGPLYTAIVPPRNFVPGTPSKPAFLAPFTTDTATGLNDCSAGFMNPSANRDSVGGVRSIQLQVVDTGIFAKLFTNDTVNVSFQPRWIEYTDNVLNQSPMVMYVDITDTKNGVKNTYKNMQNPAANTIAYSFPLTLPGTVILSVPGSYTPDSTFGVQFTTDNSAFQPNQTIDQAFTVLANVNLEQLNTPYRLSSVSVVAPSGADQDILRLSERTNNGATNDPSQNIFNLPADNAPRPPDTLAVKQVIIPVPQNGADTSYLIRVDDSGQSVTRTQLGMTNNDTLFTLDKFLRWVVDSTTNPGTYDTTSAVFQSNRPIYHFTMPSTRPSFLGALGQTTYNVGFVKRIGPPGPVPIIMADGDTVYPAVDSIVVSLEACPQSVLRIIPPTGADSAAFYPIEADYHFYSHTTVQNGITYINFNDPDTMHVPDPGWYQMAAWHYQDDAAFDQPHTNWVFSQQGISGTIGPYYFPIGTAQNDFGNTDKHGKHHLAVHRLSIAGAEIIFNAPEISDATTTGDTIGGVVPGHTNPHTADFQPGDSVLVSFTGLTKDLPFPGAQFSIKTESGSQVNFANTSNYVDSILSQVQVVPNPYIVTHLGQTSTDNAKLFFTRLPPRCTIEIYALDGTLVNTLEHYGYQVKSSASTTSPLTASSYDYSQLSDQSSVETWNILTSGQQRAGSQVLFARVVAKDPNSGAESGEVIVKFAIIVGLSK